LITKADLRRWSGWLALVVVFSIACAWLSNWQFSRREEALAAIAQVAKNYDAQPVSIDDLAKLNSFNVQNQWRPAKMVGHYLVGNTVLVRNRPLDGQPGFLELIPFQLTDGRLIAIERGWIASDSNYNPPKSFPLPCAEQQTVVARVRPAEPTLGRSAPVGQLGTINIEELVKTQGIKDRIFTSIYARVATEQISANENPKPLAKPELDEGNHLSYALQWIMFALMAVAALIWGVRKEREAKSSRQSTARKRKAIGQADAEIEDSLT